MKRLLLAIVVCAVPRLSEAACSGTSPSLTAASASQTDVADCITAAVTGDTINIPSGSATWTGGVAIPATKGIRIIGAGSERIIAVSGSVLTISTGSKTLTITGTLPGSTAAISVGQSLVIAETGTETNTLSGTVTSYNSGTGSLVMDITATTGSCGASAFSNCSRWLVITVPAAQTTITSNNSTNTPLFDITENTSLNTRISNIKFLHGTGSAHIFKITRTTNGQGVVIHDCRVRGNPALTPPPDGDSTMILTNSNRGLVYNCSFSSSGLTSQNHLHVLGAVGIKDATGGMASSWNSVSNMGALDVGGVGKLYVESSDFHAMSFATSTDDNGRMAIRYSTYNNSGVGTHGADTSQYGQRYFEYYNNVNIFNGYSDGKTFGLNQWFLLRGGTFVINNNTLPALTSGDFGSKPDANLQVQNLSRNSGPNPCWGAGTSGGASYHAPRQIGHGYITGMGTSPNVGGKSMDSVTYVGDLEPGYAWANSRTLTFTNSEYAPNECMSPDTVANYIISGRDYYNDGTAKPGWSPYPYPHVLGFSPSLSFTTQPVNVNSGSVMTPFVVTATDSGFTGNVTVSLTAVCGAALSGTLTVAAVAGVATFSNVTATGVASACSLTATSSLGSAVSNNFSVTVGSPLMFGRPLQ